MQVSSQIQVMKLSAVVGLQDFAQICGRAGHKRARVQLRQEQQKGAGVDASNRELALTEHFRADGHVNLSHGGIAGNSELARFCEIAL